MDTQGSPEMRLWNWRKGRQMSRSGPWNGVRFSGVPEMTTYENMFEFQFTDTADEVSFMFDGSPVSRLALNEFGVMQRMVWDRTELAWSVFAACPRDQCDTYGLCGAFGVCNVGAAVVCGCIRGFMPGSPAEWRMRNATGGCARSTPLQCAGGDGFYALRGVKLPETHGSTVDAGATLAECGRRCLSNCPCTAYAASDIRGGGSGTGCIQWFGELMDTRFFNDGQDLFVRLAKSDLGKNGVRETLSWGTRVRIMLESAQGLDYLHKGCNLPIIHRDVKTNNILLGNNLRAKIADFGLSKTYLSDMQTHISTNAAGTAGYMDPEYYRTGWLSESSDVYSFGVVLLEVATGEPPILLGHGHIIERVKKNIATGNVSMVADARLGGAYDVNSMWKLVDTAMACTSYAAARRPTMDVVVAQLKESLTLEESHEDNSMQGSYTSTREAPDSSFGLSAR